ncbi:MAG: (R)-citramalate synthase (EC 2.3.1.182) [Olavius algarvensis Delta 4 endosymbiont]|nr:MAG: (R)-citramalate synthase (EC 2.3.1.182) [Olavius algarvensis Delta 4 endosymbiont]
MKSPILLYDTTLRDGTQGENINFSADEKLEVARKLDDMGFHYIEGGWPGSNPRDMAFFKLAQRASFKNATLTAFGATRRPGLLTEADKNLQALLESQTAAVALFGKTWDLHVQGILGITLEENLAMIRESVAFIQKNGRAVIYDAEHFFDGYHANPGYAIDTLLAALEGGAGYLVLCDTNGGTLPHQITDRINMIKTELAARTGSDPEHLPFGIGIHCHNDCGVAVANSVTAVQAGATMVHGTINGYGERCGNADLTAIVPILCLKMGLTCMSAENLAGMKKLSRFVSETANMIPVNSRPFVGESAFAHKGGIHVSAVMKDPRGYEHMDPEVVGNRRRVLVSDLSGKSNIEYKARELGIDLNGNGFDSQKIVSKIKAMEQQGYEFDVADGSFKILVEKFTKQFESLFALESFRITVEKDKDKPCTAHATIKIAVDGQYEITAAEGAGPVSALDNALRKALDKFYPHLDAMRLVDFKVRVIDGRAGTAAKVRVLIESRDQNDVWSTIGVSEDIMEASWMALADSFQYKLSKQD